ncbi:MspA family porin [Nocardia otitidiscaviarum]|uniref:MspA n=1 Tax=Nocardia otitidiscaviarum TaxID=1823 RepID=A0A378Y9L7_9NOCA|nr:MspA family porin [Nocardia otitidiscaviarum]MBF6131485.1 MspA family porin [Nocardia otitidiscaviarum]MBF6240185.1 MspA family porin [Nocardia otitidiscaviarum]MBF6482631.1 MspA family porin [Nocardia otitidiscaviarum]SUA73423.1 MspA [Nocardia otitidiscaviarum]
MSENRTNGLRRGARIAGAGAAAAVAIGLMSTGAAHADTFVPLPDGQKTSPGGEVTITRTGEQAIVSPSLAANGAGRTVWVSGNATADVRSTPEGEPGPWNGPSGRDGSNNSSTHGASRISTGYIIGCQVSIGDEAISAGVSASINLSDLGGGVSMGLELGPGQVKWVEVEGKDILKPGVYSVEYMDAEMQIQGCAGYAQARSYTVVEIIGDHYSKTTLYGMPFSIG